MRRTSIPEGCTVVLTTCIGQRFNAKDQLAWYFIFDDDGKTASLGVKGAFVIGGRYEFVSAKPNSYYTSGTNGPLLVEHLDEDDTKSEWRLAHESANIQAKFNANYRKMEALAKESNVSALGELRLQDLRRQYRMARTGADRAAVITLLTLYITEGIYK